MAHSLILASASPRRQILLAELPYPFEVAVADVDEKALEEALGPVEPEALVLALAKAKSKAVAETHQDAVVLGADTLVELDGKLLGKPKDASEALAMLRSLCGRTHQVHTAVYVSSPSGDQSLVSTTRVRFFPLDDAMSAFLEAYVESLVPMDKAGAYGIQDQGLYLVEGIEGDFYTVMGLPVAKLWRLLEGMDIAQRP